MFSLSYCESLSSNIKILGQEFCESNVKGALFIFIRNECWLLANIWIEIAIFIHNFVYGLIGAVEIMTFFPEARSGVWVSLKRD